MIRQAVILAAGNGSRIQRSHDDVPKPLRRLCGLSLIKRSILNAKLAGITDFIVVVGYKGEQIAQELSNDRSLGINLEFVTNPQWQKSNGLSLLAAQEKIRGPFLLMMADHVFDRRAIKKILKTPLQNREVILGIDTKLEDIFDLDDATKVTMEKDRIVEIGKNLSVYDAFDTGLFICSPAIFTSLDKIYQEKGDVSLTQGVRQLAETGLLGTCDVSGFFWQDVDTPEALHYAEKFLFRNLRKPTDGWIAQNINRRISLQITRLLVKTNLSANHVTGLVTLIGVLSGILVATGRYWDIVIGAILFNLSSILDGCDGEMSKLKLSASKTGEWLDTASDTLTYLVFLFGVAMGAYHQHHSHALVIESAFMFLGLFLTLGMMFFYLIRYTNSGSLVTIQRDLNDEETLQKTQGTFHWLTKIKFMMKRDFFALLFMSLAICNQLPWILHLSLIGANLSWMVVLAYKKEIFKVGAPSIAETRG